MTVAQTFTALFPFCGLGAGALGFVSASVSLFGSSSRFRSLGGIDFDATACADFERLTGSPAWCTSVEDIDPAELRARYGTRAPDVVFMSPPCKGSSRLLSAAKAKTEKYQAMNRLAVVWTEKMLAAWPSPPPLVLLENVPGLPTRAKAMLRDLRRLLRAAGYVFHASSHDCGEIGGLAQHRKRYLLVARRPASCPSLLYQPPTRRVRAVGEVLDTVPMPATAAAAAWGDLHVMPRLSWRNWLRLALIPAGGDWRDLEGVLEGRARREVFRRHAVQRWEDPSPAVTGPGGHSVEAVADPRVAFPERQRGVPRSEQRPAWYGVLGWDDSARAIAGMAVVGTGAYAVADGRARDALTDVRVLTLDEAMGLDLDAKKPPPFTPVIIAEDGTWHRPLTLLELALLQGLPAHIDGAPLALSGTRTERAEHIGNAVPVGAAAAIAERMLVALTHGALETFALGSTPVWVRQEVAHG